MATEPIDVLILTALLTKLMPNPLVSTSDITSPATPATSPLVAYTPTPGTQYLDARGPLRAEPDSPPIAFNGYEMRRGVFQVDAVVPDGKGEFPGLRLAALVAARYPQGLELPCGGFKLQFLKVPSIAAAVKDAPWVRFPVSIPYLLIN